MSDHSMHLPTQNETWGFYGTLATNAWETGGMSRAELLVAWAEATRQLRLETGAEFETIRAFLDSRAGRHFADDVVNGLRREQTIRTAIAAAIQLWSSWTIGRATHQHTGIPAGMNYLHGFMEHAAIEAEAGL